VNRRTFLSSCVGLAFLGRFLPSITAKTTPTTPTQSQSLDLSLLLQCIAEVESGGRDDLVGPCGARSKYQITERVWYQHTTLNFRKYCSADYADAIAREHLDWLCYNKPPPIDPYHVALAWHVGLSGSGQAYGITKKQSDHAQRVANLYHARHRPQ